MKERGNPYQGLILVLIFALTGALAWRLWQVGAPLSSEPATARIGPPEVPSEVREQLANDELQTIDMFRAASPSVVHIQTSNLRRDRFRMNVLEIPRGTGSGFLWNEEGHIVTNFHVILDAEVVNVTLWDHSTYPARVIGVAPDKDLAVIQIEAPTDRLHPIPVGESTTLLVGQKVLAIGNPFGLDQTLTTGVISGLGREIQSLTQRPIENVVQTDAAINPGNSGGPLLNSRGQLIGVNTQIMGPSGAYAGVGFAVPVDTVTRIVPQLIRYGRVIRPGLGVRIAPDNVLKGHEGVLILGISSNSAAAKAGLRETRRDMYGKTVLGDIIIAINERPVRNTTDLYRVMDTFEVGSTVPITIQRDGAQLSVRVTLQALE
jgi:S1-C subfamily serine protease